MASPTILIAIDDEAVRQDLLRDLERRYGEGFAFRCCATGEDALRVCEALRESETPLALVVARERLGDIAGATLLTGVHATHPEAGRVLLVGGDERGSEAAIVRVNAVGLDHYLVHPWAPVDDKLYPAVDELLGDWRARASLPYTRVRDIMEVDIARLSTGASLGQAALLVAEWRVGDLMVVDDDGSFVGVLSEGDILRSSLPDFDEILVAGGTLHDAYRVFMGKGKDLTDRPITPLVIREPLVMRPDDHVAKAATLLVERQIRLLPVVDGERLVGTVSRANICRAVLGTA